MNFVNSEIGMVHLIASMLALVFGTMILMMKKGTPKHRKIGYAYVGSMVILLVSSFMLYNLFGGFGVFHIASIVSSLTLALGMLPVALKPDKWVIYHFSWMYWSVIGLYAAFLSEVLTRTLPTPFFSAVGIGTGIIMFVGWIGFKKNLKKWEATFYLKNVKQ